MSTANLEDMNTIIDEEPKQHRRKRWPWILSGIVIMLLIIGLGAFFGYQNGIDRRKAEEQAMVQQQASEQFELALIDKAMGRYENAQARFEYVIQLDPSFPQAADQLAQVMLAINLARTPTITPTPTDRKSTRLNSSHRT